jgi:Protein of unknown function (DUF2798)
MMFTTIRRARLTYAIVMASCTCVIMSGVSTSILAPDGEFLTRWPHVFFIDLCVAIPVAIILGPFVRRLCAKLYPDIGK